MFYSSVKYQDELCEIAQNIINVEKLKNKSVLITGANGLIASYLIDSLCWLNLNRGFNIQIYALARNFEKLKIRFQENIDKDFFHYIIQDVTKPLSKKDVKFDYIVHAACSAHPIAYSKNPVEIIMANIIGTINILNSMLINKHGKLLFVSSSEVYGSNNNVEKISESDYGFIDILNPRSCYSESKRMSENICISYSKEYGIETCIVRPGFIFGSTITDDNSRADAQFLRNAFDKNDIVMKSNGTQNRSYMYVSDATSAILTVLINGLNMNAYNISSPISKATIKEFAETIASECDVKVKYEIPDDVEKAGYSVIDNCILNSEKLESLGWKPTVSFKDGIKKTVQGYCEVHNSH